MKYLRQLLIILAFVMVGELLSEWLNLPIPGNITGMLLLLAALLTNVLKLSHIEDVANFLLEHMALMFIPAGVGILTVMGYLESVWFWIVLISIISTLLVMIVTAHVVNLMIRVKEGSKS